MPAKPPPRSAPLSALNSMHKPTQDFPGTTVSLDPPGIALVVPVRDEADTLAALIETVRSQILQPAEIILVDGGSTDGTVDLARDLTAGDARYRIIEAGPATPGRGRNIGISAARSGWIALTDAGIRLEPQWLAKLWEAARAEPGAGIVYGNFEPDTRSHFQECETLVFVHPRSPKPAGVMRGPFIASSLVRKDIWERVGGFPDLRAAEDLIFMEQLEAAGVQAAWAPEATVWWKLPETPAALFRRFLTFSKHNVWAGRQRYWHHGLARFYLLCCAFFVLALAVASIWALVPPLLWLARMARGMWARRNTRGVTWLMDPRRLLGTAAVWAIVEAASLWGWLQAYLEARPVVMEGLNTGVVSR